MKKKYSHLPWKWRFIFACWTPITWPFSPGRPGVKSCPFCSNPIVPPYPCVEHSSVLSHREMERMFKKWWETTPEGKTFSWLTPFIFSTANVAIYLQLGLKTHSSQQHFIEDLEKGRNISPEDYLTWNWAKKQIIRQKQTPWSYRLLHRPQFTLNTDWRWFTGSFSIKYQR